MVTEKQRFLSRVLVGDGCWEWLGSHDSKGYASMPLGVARRREGAHRTSYRLFVGPIPEGGWIHHHCENRGCVRFDHLALVTSGQHNAIHRHNLGNRKSHCRHGHEFTPENTYTWGGAQHCRTCRRERRSARGH